MKLDTILCGNYRSAPLNEDPRSIEQRQNDGQLWLVRARQPWQHSDLTMIVEKRGALNLLKSKIRLKIGDQSFDHDNVKPYSGGGVYGSTDRKKRFVLSSRLMLFCTACHVFFRQNPHPSLTNTLN